MGAYTDRLKDAKLPERSVSVCLRGDLVAEWEQAERDLERAQKQPSDSKEGVGVGALVDRIEALQAEMSEHADDFRLRALPRHKFRKLVVAHPPRKDGGDVNREDNQLGVNRETFFPALIKASVVEPALDEDDWLALFGDTDETIAKLEAEGREDEIRQGVLTDRQFQTLEDVAWFLNRADGIDVPFSRAASLARRTTGTE
jgi:hypothetical protein